MTRWWSSPDQGVDVLRAVDDSDVTQGVGTALLGYHALAQGVLRPFTTQTLVDVAKVFTALDAVDLEPVSKALSAATRPVLGDAADRYGELLAEDIHSQAKAATERLLVQWTATGMPWPHAVERAAEVHGVPLSRLGRYATQMKGPVTPLVRQDIADRVLMEYASELGRRESDGSSDIAKSAQFEEHEHPRGEGGRFRSKSTVEERQARLARRQRRNVRQRESSAERQRQNVEAIRENVRSQVDALMNIFESKPKEAQPVVQRGVNQRGINQTGVNQKPMVQKPLEQKAVVPASKIKEAPSVLPPPVERQASAKKLEYSHRLKEQAYFIVNRHESLAIDDNGFFDPSAAGLVAYTEADLARSVMKQRPDHVMLIRVSDLPVVDTEGKGYVPAKGVKYDLRSATTWDKTVEMKSGLAELEFNFETMDLIEVDDSVQKSLDGSDLHEFNREHRRDNRGRFADMPGDPKVAERQARLARRRKRNAARIQNRKQDEAKPQVSVADQVRALLAIHQEVNATSAPVKQRGVVQGGLKQRGLNQRDVELADIAEAPEQKKTSVGMDIVERSRLANSQANEFFNKQVLILDDDDFAMQHSSYPQDFVGSRSQVNYTWRQKEVGRPRSFSLNMAVHKLQTNSRARVEPDYNYNHLEANESDALARAEVEAGVLRDRHPYGDFQPGAERRQLMDDVWVWAPVVYDYSRAKKKNVLIFEDAAAQRAYEKGEMIAFETVATDSLQEMYSYYDIDPNAADYPPAQLDPPVTVFKVRVPTSDEVNSAKPKESEW